ncbi:MAG TPA: hypothetical protein DFS52_18130, partial [Myxococcales bacterium]|nr:hypothetical protein [Myxococcales bacterium]
MPAADGARVALEACVAAAPAAREGGQGRARRARPGAAGARVRAQPRGHRAGRAGRGQVLVDRGRGSVEVKALRHPVVGGLLASLALAAAVTGHRVGAYALPGFERLELWSLDLRFALRGPRAPGPETVILAYDDRTYAADPGLWERRAGWAKVVRAAREAGARVIAIDALFSRAEQLLPAELRDEIAGYVARQPEPSTEAADGLVRRVHGELQGDAELARA